MESNVPERAADRYLKIKELEQENANLRGHIRRLEKSNQELGEENHRLKGKGEGWNKTP